MVKAFVKNGSILASAVVGGMFLRLQQSIYPKIQDNQHGNATGGYSTTTRGASIESKVLSHHRCTLEVMFTVGSQMRLVAKKMRRGKEKASGCIGFFKIAGNSIPEAVLTL